MIDRLNALNERRHPAGIKDRRLSAGRLFVHMMFKKCLLIVVIFLLLQLIGGIFLVEITVHVPRKHLAKAAEDQSQTIANQLKAIKSSVEIKTEDGILLKA